MFRKTLILMIALEGLSFAAFNFPVLSLPLLVIAGLATIFLTAKNPEWGVYILFGELFFGSRGHLFEYDVEFVSISLRLVIFAAVFIAWLFIFFIHKSHRQVFNFPALKTFYTLFALTLLGIGFGIVNGYLQGNSLANIFNDANGYLYLLILPAAVSVIKTRQQIENLMQILAAAIIVVAAKTLGLFLWFSFGFPGVASAYHWIIAQDFGEITGEVGSASRIFMQSQFYCLVGLFIFSFREKKNWLVISAALLSVIMSLSRSFWLGAACGGLFAIIIILWRFRANFRSFFVLGLKLGLIAVLEIAILYGIIAFSGGGVAEAVSSRGVNPAGEAAGNARLLLLPELVDGINKAPVFGSGFGTVVKYKSYLPDRISAENPDGEISNFAFEWGYLDIALKIGISGLIIYLFLISYIFTQGFVNLRLQIANNGMLGFMAGLVALLALNITTPFLNHPLGIGFLILSAITFFHDESAAS